VVVTVTRSVLEPHQRERVDRFLREFLPRLKREQPGVLDAFHFDNGNTGESTTLILWGDEDARAAYRDSELIKLPMAMERELGVATSREVYPISISTKEES
jgi:hypothetical protein